MYEKIKKFIFTLIYVVLWTRFVLLIIDPVRGNGTYADGLPFFQDHRFTDIVNNYVYPYSSYLIMPINALYEKFGTQWQTQWFPWAYSTDVLHAAISWMEKNQQLPLAPVLVKQLQGDMVDRVFQGYVEWFSIIALVCVRIFRSVWDYVFEFCKNLFWTVFIEMSFSRKKQAAYQQKLEQRAKDLMKLKVEYRNLSKEASQLSTAVVTDELTQVYNKRFFIEKIKHEFQVARSQRIYLSLVMMDIDHFKKLNDTHGHMVGDVVLKAVAKAVKKHTPKAGFCCRFGGEEFSLILPGYTHEQAMAVLEPMRQEVENLTFKESPDVKTSISMGVISANFNHPDAQALATFEDYVKLADDELYRAKLGGRNRINFNQIK